MTAVSAKKEPHVPTLVASPTSSSVISGQAKIRDDHRVPATQVPTLLASIISKRGLLNFI
jgi:hypothetical protein